MRQLLRCRGVADGTNATGAWPYAVELTKIFSSDPFYDSALPAAVRCGTRERARARAATLTAHAAQL